MIETKTTNVTLSSTDMTNQALKDPWCVDLDDEEAMSKIVDESFYMDAEIFETEFVAKFTNNGVGDNELVRMSRCDHAKAIMKIDKR
jgi:hypothetical protein